MSAYAKRNGRHLGVRGRPSLECQLISARALERVVFAAVSQGDFDQPDDRPHQIGGNANHAGLPSARGVLVLSFARIFPFA